MELKSLGDLARVFGKEELHGLTAFGINIVVEGYGLSEPFGSGGKGYLGARLALTGRPDHVVLHLRAKAQDGISPIAVYREEAIQPKEDLDVFFSVPLQWKEKDGIWFPVVPDWREEKNFANVISPNGDLHFSDVQISLVRRGNTLYVMVQKVYQGWIREEQGEITFIPSHPHFARLDYQKVWKARGQVLAILGSFAAEVAKALGGMPFSNPEPARWNPPPPPSSQKEGWVSSVVAHYNPVTNSGLAIGDDGTEYQLLGRNLEGWTGPVPLPPPMSRVLILPGRRKHGYTRTPVKSCRPYIPGWR